MKPQLARASLACALLGALLPLPAQADPISCTANFTSPLSIKVPGHIAAILIDDTCRYIYATNSAYNRVEVFSLETGQLLAPIQVGSQPIALDTSPDGATLYVANSGAHDISIVDLQTRTEKRRVKINLPADTPDSVMDSDRVTALAVAQNGRVLLVAKTFYGYGRVMMFDPSTGTVKYRKDAPSDSGTDGGAVMRANGDRSAIFLAHGNISKYIASSDSFTSTNQIDSYIYRMAVNYAGDVILGVSNQSTSVLNGDLKVTSKIPYSSVGGALAVNTAGTVGYTVSEGNDGSNGYIVEYGKLNIIKKDGANPYTGLSVGDTVTFSTAKDGNNASGSISASRDGALVAIGTDHGFSLMRVEGTGSSARLPGPSLRTTVFSSAQPSAQSRFRFYNAGPFAETVTITLTDLQSGQDIATWTSPSIQPKSAPEYSIATIEAAAAQSANKSTFYIAKIQTAMTGSFTHILFNPAHGVRSNITVCDNGAGAPPKALVNVNNSISNSDSESYLSIVNTGSTPLENITLFLQNAGTGGRMGNYKPPTIAGGAALILPISDVEKAARVNVRATAPEYTVQAETDFTGYLQHLVRQKSTNTFVDMTPSCALPPS